MATSQQSYEARLGRFKAGNDLIQTWGDYSPSNPLIIKANIPVFITSIETANTSVNSTKTALDNARSARAPLVFKHKDTNPDCLENRIVNIANYLAGDFGASHPATKFVKAIVKKIRPQYEKKLPDAPRGAGKSPMEKSYASAVGHGQDVIDRVTALGIPYKPADNNLKVAGMQALVDLIKTSNTAVTTALEPYGIANRSRKDLYDSTTGIAKRIVNVKGYLSSFAGGKKSNHYIEFSQAVKGT